MNLGVKNDFPVYLSDPCGYIRARDSIHTAKTFKICLNFLYILCFSVTGYWQLFLIHRMHTYALSLPELLRVE